MEKNWGDTPSATLRTRICICKMMRLFMNIPDGIADDTRDIY